MSLVLQWRCCRLCSGYRYIKQAAFIIIRRQPLILCTKYLCPQQQQPQQQSLYIPKKCVHLRLLLALVQQNYLLRFLTTTTRASNTTRNRFSSFFLLLRILVSIKLRLERNNRFCSIHNSSWLSLFVKLLQIVSLLLERRHRMNINQEIHTRTAGICLPACASFVLEQILVLCYGTVFKDLNHIRMVDKN